MSVRDEAVELLRRSGFNEIGTALHVGSATIEFDFILWSTNSGFNLVVGAAPRADLSRRVAALARALDYMGSKASITLIIDADRLDLKTHSEVSQYARVLFARGDSLEDDLRVLLPLHLERRAAMSVDPMALLRESFVEGEGDPMDALLIGLSTEDRVRESLRTFIENAMVDG